MSRMVKRRRFPWWISRCGIFVIFFPVWWLLMWVCGYLAARGLGWLFPAPIENARTEMVLEVAFVVLVALIAAGLACHVCLTIYARLAWKEVPDDGSQCASCAYDLTGNASGVCPECGTPVAQQAKDGKDA